MTAADIIERVARGASFLDEKRPGWHDRIDLTRLDLGDCKRCILGQAVGDFNQSIAVLFGSDADDAVRHGFDVRKDHVVAFAELTAEWRRVIRVRRGGAS